MFGSVTYQNTCQPLAPSTTAASSSSRPCACISGISSRATNGNVTKIDASTMPGSAKITLKPWLTSQPPMVELAPKVSMNIRPTMTGDTENGRSISVVSNCLPRKSNLAINHAAATPNTRLSGTATAATISVNLSAAMASGCTMASRYGAKPRRSASTNTAIKGIRIKIPKNDRLSPRMLHLIQRGSRVAALRSKRVSDSTAVVPTAVTTFSRCGAHSSSAGR